MKRVLPTTVWIVCALLVTARVRAQAPPRNAIPGQQNLAPADVDDDGDVYTRGVLHEAFAVPSTDEPVRTPVIARQPPQPIDELPPDEKPAGENVVWIPGYWAFDQELDDFIWISGLWRTVPPDREWVPGYWAPAQGGSQWVPGMWVSAGQQELAYYPQPPATQERGPSGPSPGDDYFYVPGSWEYRQTHFAWRPGYWAPRQMDWIWIPARWVWTPSGYCFIPGYWDYVLVQRGLCYAPIYFPHDRPYRPYRPIVVINTWNQLTINLFVQPAYGVYVFGNYYNTPPGRYVPWYQYNHGPRAHDPMFAYYNWRYGPSYGRRLEQWHEHYVTHPDARPHATLREESQFAAHHQNGRDGAPHSLVVDLRHRDQEKETVLPVALAKLSPEESDRARDRSRSLREMANKRVQMEEQSARKPGPRSDEPRKIAIDLPKARDAAPTADVKRPESPDKLKNVKPDSPRSGQARIPAGQRRVEKSPEEDAAGLIAAPPGADESDDAPAGRRPTGKPRPSAGGSEKSDNPAVKNPERRPATREKPGDGKPSPDKQPTPAGRPRPGADGEKSGGQGTAENPRPRGPGQRNQERPAPEPRKTESPAGKGPEGNSSKPGRPVPKNSKPQPADSQGDDPKSGQPPTPEPQPAPAPKLGVRDQASGPRREADDGGPREVRIPKDIAAPARNRTTGSATPRRGEPAVKKSNARTHAKSKGTPDPAGLGLPERTPAPSKKDSRESTD